VQGTILSSSLKVAAPEQAKHACQEVSQNMLEKLGGLYTYPSIVVSHCSYSFVPDDVL
jgi:hypothetical protein